MKKIMIVLMVLLNMTLFSNSYASPTLPSLMSPTCEEGEIIFYGRLIKTKAIEKICKKDNDYYFYTQDNKNSPLTKVKLTDVKQITTTGVDGKVIGYEFMLLTGDNVKCLALYEKNNTYPFKGYFIINDYTIELDPLTIVIKK